MASQDSPNAGRTRIPVEGLYARVLLSMPLRVLDFLARSWFSSVTTSLGWVKQPQEVAVDHCLDVPSVTLRCLGHILMEFGADLGFGLLEDCNDERSFPIVSVPNNVLFNPEDSCVNSIVLVTFGCCENLGRGIHAWWGRRR